MRNDDKVIENDHTTDLCSRVKKRMSSTGDVIVDIVRASEGKFVGMSFIRCRWPEQRLVAAQLVLPGLITGEDNDVDGMADLYATCMLSWFAENNSEVANG